MMLTPKDVSAIIGIGMTNTYKLFNLKGFPKIRIGKKFFVSQEDFEEFMKKYKNNSIYLN